MLSKRGIVSLAGAFALWLTPQLALGANKLFMWKVSSALSTVYLVGSIHMVPPDFYPLPKTMEKAFDDSHTLVLEIDESKTDPHKTQQQTIALGAYTDGDNISNHISDDTKKALGNYTKGLDGMTAMSITKMRPWLASVTIPILELQKRGFDGKLGVDKHFLDQAKSKSKNVEELESTEFQLKMLSGFSDDLQDKLLLSSLIDAENTDRDAKEMVAAWKSGDDQLMDTVATRDEKEHPELKPVMERLLYERNAGMLTKIEDYLKSGKKTFVVVGAAHVVGPRGLLAMLKEKKYKIEQISGG